MNSQVTVRVHEGMHVLVSVSEHLTKALLQYSVFFSKLMNTLNMGSQLCVLIWKSAQRLCGRFMTIYLMKTFAGNFLSYKPNLTLEKSSHHLQVNLYIFIRTDNNSLNPVHISGISDVILSTVFCLLVHTNILN